MGDWDFYCFLCSGGFYIPTNQLEEWESKKIEELHDLLVWLSDFRTIGENLQVSSIKKCYITGPARSGSHGSASIQRGDHPNAPSDISWAGIMVGCYLTETGDLPIHDECLRVLGEAFARARGISWAWTKDVMNLPFDLDVLFECLGPLRQEYQSHLDLGVTPEYIDQYFQIPGEDVVSHSGLVATGWDLLVSTII